MTKMSCKLTNILPFADNTISKCVEWLLLEKLQGCHGNASTMFLSVWNALYSNWEYNDSRRKNILIKSILEQLFESFCFVITTSPTKYSYRNKRRLTYNRKGVFFTNWKAGKIITWTWVDWCLVHSINNLTWTFFIKFKNIRTLNIKYT